MLLETKISRRGFLQTAGALTFSFTFAGRVTNAVAQGAAAKFNTWVSIGTDGTVTVMMPAAEMGQGSLTALSLILAEELDADWSKVRPEAPAYDPQLGSQGTGGSGSVLDTHSRLRVAGATMRQMLVAAAAQQLGVPASELTTRDSRVIHAASNRSVGYGALADAASKVAVPTNVRLRRSLS